jgi:hypothetical protein
MLMKLRETLTDDGESGTKVTCPNEISIHPHNLTVWFWSIMSLLALIASVAKIATDY